MGVIFLDCPAYLDEAGAARCGLPAAVEYRYTVESTDGPVESAKIRCPGGHWFNGPLASLTWDKDAGQAVSGAPATREEDTALRSPGRCVPAGPRSGGRRTSDQVGAGAPDPEADGDHGHRRFRSPAHPWHEAFRQDGNH